MEKVVEVKVAVVMGVVEMEVVVKEGGGGDGGGGGGGRR